MKNLIINFLNSLKSIITNKNEHLFGIWKDKNIDVDNFVRNLRKSRKKY